MIAKRKSKQEKIANVASFDREFMTTMIVCWRLRLRLRLERHAHDEKDDEDVGEPNGGRAAFGFVVYQCLSSEPYPSWTIKLNRIITSPLS